MQIIFEFRVNIHRLSIHLGNDPSVLQQFVDSDKILIVVDIILLCKITAVADVNDLLHCFTPLYPSIYHNLLQIGHLLF